MKALVNIASDDLRVVKIGTKWSLAQVYSKFQ